MELPKRYDPKESEPKWQKFWEENKVYKFNKESKAEIWARGHALSARNNWADFGTLSTIKLRKNEAGNTFCDITNAEGKTSSMKLLSEVEWDLFYELQVTLQEYKEAKAEMNILISAHGKWSTKDYFNLVQVVV